jgi:hypothetical protein
MLPMNDEPEVITLAIKENDLGIQNDSFKTETGQIIVCRLIL